MTAEDFNELAWHDGVLWAFDEPEIREQFERDTGIALRASGMNRLVDEATGKQKDDLEVFVEWFDRNIWGEEMSPRLAKEKR